MQPKISVVVPIYNVEPFIARCAESLFRQTMREVEYIFINDATPDKSMQVLDEVLASYPDRKRFVQVLAHETNKGLPAARNTGLAVAQGEYIFHCDSDDFVEPTMLADLYQTATEKNAEIVWCDWFLSYEKSERHMRQPEYSTPLDAMRAMLSGAMKYNVWNKLVKRSLYTENNIVFPEGYGMGEDMTMMLLFSCATRIAYLPNAYYHYVKLNAGAFSQTYSDKHIGELKHNVQWVTEYMHAKYHNQIEKELAFFHLEAKFPFLINDGKDGKYHLWTSWYPEANKYIMANRHITLRSRLVQWFAWKRQWWLVRLYYKIIIKTVYSIIYK